MALFGGKGDKDKAAEPAVAKPTIRQLPARMVSCRLCDTTRPFSRVWVRLAPIAVCTACKMPFDNPAALYAKSPPACPNCGEYLEHPGFEYGLCDVCHSKYEVMPGTKPGLLPNRKQREEMNKVGRVWRPE